LFLVPAHPGYPGLTGRKTVVVAAAAAAAVLGQSQRSNQHCDELKAEIKLLKQDLHTSKKEFILTCR